MKCFAHYPVLALCLPISEVKKIRLLPVSIFDTQVQVEDGDETKNQQVWDTLSENVFWILSSLYQSRSVSLPPRVIEKLMEAINTRAMLSAIRTGNTASQVKDINFMASKALSHLLALCTKQSYFVNVELLFSGIWNDFKSMSKAKQTLMSVTNLPDHHHLVQRIVLTPTRTCLLSPTPVASNRLLRLLDETGIRCVIVSFKDENFGKLVDVSTFKYVSDAIENGITVKDDRYLFLCSTPSQLREHKAYFIAVGKYEGDSLISNIRNRIVENPLEFLSVAKYMSRLGLYGTADFELFRLSKNDVHIDLDDCKALDGDLVTDGAGKIASSLVEKIAHEWSKPIYAALQVRYSGVKGILVRVNDSDIGLNGKVVALRPSMQKFWNKDTAFCLVEGSKVNDLKLNREVITLLTSLANTPEGSEWRMSLETTLSHYHEYELSEAAAIFVDSLSASEKLKSFLPLQDIELIISSGFQVISEEYWFKILQGVYRLLVRELRTKTNITIKKGSLLMGIPDPCEVLCDNEVFLQINNTVITGPVLIYRNPCLHPGDVRRVLAVDDKQLHYLSDVVVLPVKNATYSLASSCSGGDLDGDKYAVIWDSNLVPPENCIKKPCSYTELASDERNARENVTNKHVISDYFERFMKNDALGRVAHIHLALCDIQEQGALDPLAMELAKSQSQAVDYPKTGIIPQVPQEALEIVSQTGYPDFMEKPLSETYVSNKILGQLYRRCTSLAFDFEVVPQGNSSQLFDIGLFVQGHESYLEEGAIVYKEYSHCMQTILQRFELTSEACIILGQATHHWSQILEPNKGKASECIKNSYKQLVKKFRAEFFKDVFSDIERQKKASSWYRIVNDNSIKVHGSTKQKFLSFPWIVSDVLCQIKCQQKIYQPSLTLCSIGNSIIQHFATISRDMLVDHKKKTRVVKDIENSIDSLCKQRSGYPNAFQVCLYGSTSIFLSETDSDIDICILPTKKAYAQPFISGSQEFCMLPKKVQDVHFLENFVSAAVDKIAVKKDERFNASVPIIYCQIGDDQEPLSCDISMNETGYLKTIYILSLYKMSSLYLPVFWTLVHWARSCGLIRSAIHQSSAAMDTAEFYAIMILVLKCPSLNKDSIPRGVQSTNTLAKMLQKLKSLTTNDLYETGRMLHTFFREASQLKGNIKCAWPLDDVPEVNLDESKIKTLASFSSNAYHCLSATRDVTKLMANTAMLSTTKQCEYSKKLPMSLSHAMSGAIAFHSARLTTLTGASVSITVTTGMPNLVVSAEGTPTAISKVREEIRSLLFTNKALVLGRLPQKSSRYFVEGSAIVFGKGHSSISSQLQFSESFGPYELVHSAMQRSSVYIRYDDPDSMWIDKASERLVTHIFKQLEKFPRENESLLNALAVTTRFGCFYAVNVSERLPESVHSLSIEDFQIALEKGRFNRKRYERGDYNATASSRKSDGNVSGNQDEPR